MEIRFFAGRHSLNPRGNPPLTPPGRGIPISRLAHYKFPSSEGLGVGCPRAFRLGLLVFVLSAFLAGMARAYPGEGIMVGDTLLTPYLETLLGYDSNIFLARDPQSDISLKTRIGVETERDLKLTVLHAELWGLRASYLESGERDYTDAGEALGFDIVLFEKLKLRLAQEYRLSSEDQDFITDMIQDFQRMLGDISFGWAVGERLNAGVGYSAKGGLYEQEELHDWLQQTVSSDLEYEMTDAATVGLSSDTSLVDSEAYADDAVIFAEHLDFGIKLTDKTKSSFGVGWQRQDAVTEVSIPSARANASWQATEKIGVGIESDVQIRPAVQYEENSIVIRSGTLKLTYAATDAISLGLSGTYQQNGYVNDVRESDGTLRSLDEDVVQGSASVHYIVPLKFLSVFVRTDYQEKISTLASGGYDRYGVSLGMRLQY